MSIRLQKAIASAGIASRRKAEQMILGGLVVVNGETITKLGTHIDPKKDTIKVEGKRIRLQEVIPILYVLYKPKNCVTTLDDPQGRDTIVRYFPKRKHRLFPVGRLDYDSEGLVLLTNDGDLAHRITHPSKHIWKQYFVKLKGRIGPCEISKLINGPVINGKKRQAVKIKFLHYINDKSWLAVSLQEGLRHHIKKMFKSIGYPVQKIKRYKISNIELREMKPGDVRRVTPEEYEALLTLIGSK